MSTGQVVIKHNPLIESFTRHILVRLNENTKLCHTINGYIV